MTVARCKKKSNPKAWFDRPAETPFTIVKNANYVSFAIMLRVLKDEGWGPKRFQRLCESYFALAEELADHRNSIEGLIRDTKALTGVDVKKLIDDAYDWR